MALQKRNLRPEDWLKAGLRILAKNGHESLKIIRLVKEARASTGSFYWHFKNIEEYRQALTCYWVTDVLPAMALKAKQLAKSPEQQLEQLWKTIQADEGYAYDAAIRRWAETSDHAANAITEADQFRRKVVVEAAKGLRNGEGLTNEQMNLLGMAWRGSTDMSDQQKRFKLLGLITGGIKT